MTSRRVHIAYSGIRRCHELVATASLSNTPFGNDWPVSPGAVRRKAGREAELLHFAPGRWLVPEPDESLLRALAARADLALVDVEGKWARRELTGPGVPRLLATAADIESMLANRECAALALFDCPVILARRSGAFDLWVHASYAQFLDERLVAARSAFE